MDNILKSADPAALIAHRESVLAALQTLQLIESICRGEDRPLDAILGHWASGAATSSAMRLLARWAAREPADSADALRQGRAFWCASQVLQREDRAVDAARQRQADALKLDAFARVAAANEIAYATVQPAPACNADLKAGVEIVAESPVRLDLAGGWSDTPPFCFERGGHVVNVAIDLDGRPPVSATVRTTAERRLIVESRDLGRQLDLTEPARDAVPDVRDPFALHKVALNIAGLSDARALPAGVRVTTECRVPKGSGLGTSSILAATLLAALHAVRGSPVSQSQLVEQTQLLEQRLTTGGGWQDQVGGIAGGVKSTISAPGLPQELAIEQLPLSNERLQVLQERLVVYYSGQQRLARDILRRVMGRWLAREPAMLDLMADLKASAAALREALLASRWDDVGSEIRRYWRLKKDLYPGSATAAIDVLFSEMRPHCLAAGLAGAGGGGFAYFFCSSAAQAGELRQRLTERAAQQASLGTVYPTQINRDGLVVRALSPATVT